MTTEPTSPEVERALRAQGLDEDAAKLAARAARSEAAAPLEAPAHPCPQHAQWPVLETCSRCGAFICARCLNEAGFESVPPSKQCPACESRSPQPQGIGGWLVLPALHVGLMVPLSTMYALGQDAIALKDLAPEVIPPVLLQMAFNALLLSFSIYVAIAFFQRKRRAVQLMVLMYASLILSAVFSAVVANWLESITGATDLAGESIVQTGGALLSSLVWITYFGQSTRVKTTFIVP